MAEIKNRESMIHIRGGYSDKYCRLEKDMVMQINDFDKRTRTKLSNTVRLALERIAEAIDDLVGWSKAEDFIRGYGKFLVAEVFVEPLTQVAFSKSDVWDLYEEKVQQVFLKAPYNEVLDFIWINAKWIEDTAEFALDLYTEAINGVFEEELVGYRLIGGEIAPISDEVEQRAIELVLESDIETCRNHIQKALKFMSRNNKDYKNSIKESISAVEAACKVITGKEKATLGDALNILEREKGLKGQLKSGFEKLYSYTNEKGGIRHSEGLFVSDVSFSEAKYMLVSCCAFVNYLLDEYRTTTEK